MIYSNRLRANRKSKGEVNRVKGYIETKEGEETWQGYFIPEGRKQDSGEAVPIFGFILKSRDPVFEGTEGELRVAMAVDGEVWRGELKRDDNTIVICLGVLGVDHYSDSRLNSPKPPEPVKSPPCSLFWKILHPFGEPAKL